LPHAKGDHALVGLADAAGAAHDVVPPFLAEQHCLGQQVVGGLQPGWMGEAIVIGPRLNHCLSSHGRAREALPLSQRRAPQRGRLERRIRSVGGPIKERETNSAGRSPAS